MQANAKNSALSTQHSVLIALILMHLLIALPLAYLLNIWTDEASTLYTTQNGFLATFQNVFKDEKQAPLYFLVLSLWRVLNDSIFFARLFSILCSIAAIKVFYDLTSKLFAWKKAFFVTFFFAIHPFLIWASLEIRVYSSVILLSVLLIKLFHDGYFENQADEEKFFSKTRLFYVLCAITALYTNYYLGFLLVGNFTALLAAKKWKEAKSYFQQMMIVGAAILPLIVVIKQQFAANTSGYIAERSFSEIIVTFWNQFFFLTFPITTAISSDLSVMAIIRIIFACLAIISVIFWVIKNGFHSLNKNTAAFAAIILTLMGFMLCAYFVLGKVYIADRHFAVFFVPLVLLVASSLINILPDRWLMVFGILLVLLFPYSQISNKYYYLAKRGDWQRIAAYIETHEKPNQPIIVFQNYDALSLPFYYKGKNKILPDERYFDWESEDAWTSEKAFQNQINYIISRIPPGTEEIWLATEEVCQAENTQVACRPLENFLQANYTIVETKDFYQERLRLLRKK
jgi:uncharacterized membrane protein